MKERQIGRKLLITGAVAAVLVAFAPSRACVASTLPNPAARFIHFFQKSSAAEKVGQGKVGLWERFLYSLILASSAPTDRKTPVTSSSVRPS
jgi:hypothetical protein